MSDCPTTPASDFYPISDFYPTFVYHVVPNLKGPGDFTEHYPNGEFNWRCCNCQSEWKRRSTECTVCDHMRCDACTKFAAT